MNQLPPDILVTAQMDLLSLVSQLCPPCPQVIIPPGADHEPDIFRCKAAAGKHCVTAINTKHCIRDKARPGATDEPLRSDAGQDSEEETDR